MNSFFRSVAITPKHQPASSFVPPSTVKFKFHKFTVSSVLAQVRRLDVRKVTGPNGISACLLKSVAEEIAYPLTFIFNLLIQSGTIPSAWKQSNITPVHRGGSCDDTGNF